MATATVQVASVFNNIAFTQIAGDYSNYVLLDSGTETIASDGGWADDVNWNDASQIGGVSFTNIPTTTPILCVRPRTDGEFGDASSIVPPFRNFKASYAGWDYCKTYPLHEYGSKFDWRLYVPMSDTSLTPPGSYGMRIMDEGGSIIFDSRFLDEGAVMSISDMIYTPQWHEIAEYPGAYGLYFFYGVGHSQSGTTSSDAPFYSYSTLLVSDFAFAPSTWTSYLPAGGILLTPSFMAVTALGWDDAGTEDINIIVEGGEIIDGSNNISADINDYCGITFISSYKGAPGGNDWPINSSADGINLYPQAIMVIDN